MKTSEILREAYERLTPERWFQGTAHRPVGTAAGCAQNTKEPAYCAMMAIKGPRSKSAYGALIAANDLPCSSSPVSAVVAWNNSPDTTFEDVKLGFKRAIAWAEERGE